MFLAKKHDDLLIECKVIKKDFKRLHEECKKLLNEMKTVLIKQKKTSNIEIIFNELMKAEKVFNSV